MAKFFAIVLVIAAASYATAQQQCGCTPQPTVIQLSCGGNKPPMVPIFTMPPAMPPQEAPAPAPAPAPASAPAPAPASGPAPAPASAPASGPAPASGNALYQESFLEESTTKGKRPIYLYDPLPIPGMSFPPPSGEYHSFG